MSDGASLNRFKLARELGIHERTLRSAARTGHLCVQFLSRSAFGRPIARHPGRWARVHVDALPPFRGAWSGTCTAADRSGRLRHTFETAPPTTACEPGRSRRSNRCGRKGSRLSVGIAQANAITRFVAACPPNRKAAQLRTRSTLRRYPGPFYLPPRSPGHVSARTALDQAPL